ncbi:MAG TPA: hypothetical protein VKA68_14055 [bacterium]|nr:hypothetical protein [bacterium]
MRVSARVILLVVATCVFLVGCDLTEPTDETNPECGADLEKGSFEAEITGYVDKSFEGAAVFETVQATTGEPIFFLRLSDANNSGEIYRNILFERFRHNTPDIGIYDLANLAKSDNQDMDRFAGTYNDTDISGEFKTAGGTLQICSANTETLTGGFDFHAYELVQGNDGEQDTVQVRITGKFRAEQGDTGIIIY